jgi:hypothetical protein
MLDLELEVVPTAFTVYGGRAMAVLRHNIYAAREQAKPET